jgi:hypothetical protein
MAGFIAKQILAYQTSVLVQELCQDCRRPAVGKTFRRRLDAAFAGQQPYDGHRPAYSAAGSLMGTHPPAEAFHHREKGLFTQSHLVAEGAGHSLGAVAAFFTQLHRSFYIFFLHGFHSCHSLPDLCR